MVQIHKYIFTFMSTGSVASRLIDLKQRDLEAMLFRLEIWTK